MKNSTLQKAKDIESKLVSLTNALYTVKHGTDISPHSLRCVLRDKETKEKVINILNEKIANLEEQLLML